MLSSNNYSTFLLVLLLLQRGETQKLRQHITYSLATAECSCRQYFCLDWIFICEWYSTSALLLTPLQFVQATQWIICYKTVGYHVSPKLLPPTLVFSVTWNPLLSRNMHHCSSPGFYSWRNHVGFSFPCVKFCSISPKLLLQFLKFILNYNPTLENCKQWSRRFLYTAVKSWLFAFTCELVLRSASLSLN